MTLEQAIKDSNFDAATLIEYGYGYYVDGSDGASFVVTHGVEGMPVQFQGRCATLEEVKAMLPADRAASNDWEAVGEADS